MSIVNCQWSIVNGVLDAGDLEWFSTGFADEHRFEERGWIMNETWGIYDIQRELGHGGFATVYLAENRMLGTPVALKVLEPSLAKDEKVIRRFQGEARHAARLNHPNIVRILGFEEFNGRFFITMDYVQGTDLQKHLQEGLVSLKNVVKIIKQIGSALDYAHEKGLIHRDVKPSNILLERDGTAKLTDFGIVRAIEGTTLTPTGAMMGTAVYMSPEQSKGEKLDGRSDIYSLAVVAYELMTNQTPFSGETPAVICVKHIQEPPPAPSSLHPRASGAIEAVLLKALAKDVDTRYQSGEELGEALETAVNEVTGNKFDNSYEQACALQASRQFADALHEMEILVTIQPDYKDVAERIVQIKNSQRQQSSYDEMSQQWESAQTLAAEILVADPDFPDEKRLLQRITERPQVVETATQPRLDWVNMLRASGISFLVSAIFLGFWARGIPRHDNFYWSSSLSLLDYALARSYAIATITVIVLYAILLFVQYGMKKSPAWLSILRMLLIIITGIWMLIAYMGTDLNLPVSTGPWLILLGFLSLFASEAIALIHQKNNVNSDARGTI